MFVYPFTSLFKSIYTVAFSTSHCWVKSYTSLISWRYGDWMLNFMDVPAWSWPACKRLGPTSFMTRTYPKKVLWSLWCMQQCLWRDNKLLYCITCHNDTSSHLHMYIEAVLMKYDHTALLECLEVLDRGLKGVMFGRKFENWDQQGQESRSNKVHVRALSKNPRL